MKRYKRKTRNLDSEKDKPKTKQSSNPQVLVYKIDNVIFLFV